MTYVYAFGYLLTKYLGATLFDLQIHHQKRALLDGPVIYAMNHQSFLDPPLAGMVPKREVYFLGRKTLHETSLMGNLFYKMNTIPIDLTKSDITGLKSIIRVLREKQSIVIFPEGTRSRDGTIGEAKGGMGLIIAKSNAPVVPMRIFGANRALQRGGFRLRFTPIDIVVGEPIYDFSVPNEADRVSRYRHISEQVMESIRELKLPPEAEGRHREEHSSA